jgi:hypothetical protein
MRKLIVDFGNFAESTKTVVSYSDTDDIIKIVSLDVSLHCRDLVIVQ